MPAKPELVAAAAALAAYEGLAEASRALLAAAASKAFAGQVKSCSLDGLRGLHAALGDGVFRTLCSENVAATKAVLKRLDKGNAEAHKLDAAGQAASLTELAGGSRDVAKPLVLKGMGLEKLRETRASKGDAFGGWLAAASPADRKAVLKAIDPRLPGLGKLTPADITARVAELAGNGEPFPDIRLATMDLGGLRDACGKLGREQIESWLVAQAPADLKTAIGRIDSHRVRPERLGKAEIVLILSEIADGGDLARDPAQHRGIGGNEL